MNPAMAMDMSGMVTVLDSRHVYQGAIFGVDDLWIALTDA